MRSVLAAVAALAVGHVAGCDGSGSGVVDTDGGGSGGDDGGGGGEDAGGGDPSAHSVKVTLANRPNSGAPFSFLVAYQDGSAAWQLAPAPAGDVYTLPIHAPTYGVAFACIGTTPGSTPTQVRSVTAAFFAIGERDKLTLDVPARCSDRTTPTVTLSGTITNRPLGGVLSVNVGGKSAFVGSQSGNFSLQAPTGTHDIVVTRAIPQGNGDFYVDQVWLQRNVALNAATVRTINFADAEYTSTFNVDLGPPTLDRATVSTTLYGVDGGTVGLVRVSQNLQTESLGAAQMQPSDLYDQSITVARLGGSATVTNATIAPADQTWVAPVPLGQIQTTVPTKMPYVTLETSWPAYANAVGYQWNATQQPAQSCGNSPCTIVWSAYVSPGVVGTMPAFRMPDLHAVAGWKTAFELGSGTQIVGGVTALTSNLGAADFPTVTPPVNGTKRTFVRTDFAVTP